MINKENLLNWLEHPMTVAYFQQLEITIKEKADTTQIRIQNNSIESIAMQVIANQNFLNGLRAAADITTDMMRAAK
jgi:hypothetical protein